MNGSESKGVARKSRKREVTDRTELRDILERTDVCRIAFSSNEGTDIGPLNFGFEWDRTLTLYFHGGNVERELDRMRRGGCVDFEVDVDHLLPKDQTAGERGVEYQSLTGTGLLSEVADEEGRRRGLEVILCAIMRRYGFQGRPIFGRVSFQDSVVLRLDVERINGQRRV